MTQVAIHFKGLKSYIIYIHIYLCVCIYIYIYTHTYGIPAMASGKESTYQCRGCKRSEFDPWVWKISWREKWQPAPVFLPGKLPWAEEPGRLQFRVAKELEMAEHLHLQLPPGGPHIHITIMEFN